MSDPIFALPDWGAQVNPYKLQPLQQPQSYIPEWGATEPGSSSVGMPAWSASNAATGLTGTDGGFDFMAGLKNLFSGALGSTDKPGWGAPMLTAIGGLANTYLGMQQYGLAKDRLAEAKRQYNQDYQIQKNLTNSRLEDRQRARVASNAGAYQSVGEYMNQYGVRG